MKLGHIINTVKVEENPNLFSLQEITLKSMVDAQAYFKEGLVDLFAIQEGGPSLSHPEINSLPSLQQSVRDFLPNATKPLPLIQEILGAAKDHISCDYLIYTNCDIILTPHFYESVAYYLNKGYDALVINRQRVSIALDHVDDLPAIFAEKGMIHPGFDCFVFKRDLLEKIDMGNICLGIPFIGVGLAHWVFSLSKNPLFLGNANMTRHIGLEVMPKVDPVLYKHNRQEFLRIKQRIPWKENLHKFPYSLRPFPKNLIQWGANPSLSTKDFIEWKFWGLGRKIRFRLNQLRWRLLK